MTFVVYATYSVAIAIFVFWFGVWMLHLIAIAYGKIRLHKKSSLHLKLQQQELLHQRQHVVHRNQAKNSLYDDLHLHHHHNYNNLHQLMQQHGPSPVTVLSPGGGVVGGASAINDVVGGVSGDGLNSNCDYSPISGGQAGCCGGGGSEGGAAAAVASLIGSNRGDTVINLSCDEFSLPQAKNHHHHQHSRNKSKDLSEGDALALASGSSPSSSSSSGVSSAASSPEGAMSAATTATVKLLPSAADPKITGLMAERPLLLGSKSPAAAASTPTAEGFVGRLPKVSILKPLMGLDANLAANLESFFTMAYPRQCYEVLFCVESEEDPVLALCQSLIDKYKGEVDARLFIGGAHVGVNPKINNMEPGYREAKYELIMISDAGIKMKEDTLLDMVEHMTEKVGLVHQMPFTCDREGFAATYEKIFFGTIQSRIYLVSDCLNVICHTGMSCLTRKKVLEGMGGLKAFGCYLAEDFFMAKAITDAGWKITISSYPALQNSGVCDVKTFQNRLVRWAKLRIAMLSWLILLEPLSECLIIGAFASWGVSVLFHWDSLAFYLIHVLCWFLADWMLLTIVQNGSVSFNKFNFVVGWLFRELSGPYLFFCALWNPAIRWRTRVYKLEWGGVAYELNSSTKIKT